MVPPYPCGSVSLSLSFELKFSHGMRSIIYLALDGGGERGDHAQHRGGQRRHPRHRRHGLTIVPISAQLELFCPPCNPI